MEPYGPAVLRVIVGAMFVAHGVQKLFGPFGGGVTDAPLMVGLSPGFVVIAVTQLGGGLLLVAGALTRFACSALILVMLVAMWRVPLANGFFLNWALTPGRGHGIEYNLVVVGALLCLALTGPGAFSLDHRRARTAEMDAAGRARLRGKL